MIEVIGGALVIIGGGMLSVSSIALARAQRTTPIVELVAALPFTPFARPDPALDALMRDVDAALARD